MKKQTQNSENLEIPSRWRRFFAFLLDLFFTITIIGGLINLIFILLQKDSLGNIIMGIKSLNNDGDKITDKQRIFRYSLIFPTSIPFSFDILFFMMLLCWPVLFLIEMFRLPISILSWDNKGASGPELGDSLAGIFGVLILIFIIIVLIINIIEIFQPCPTFIDKRLGIKRLYKKSK